MANTGWSYIPGTTVPSMAGENQAGIRARIVGLRKQEKGINNAIALIKGVTILGLKKAATDLRREIENAPQNAVPKGKTGHLRSSWFIHDDPSSTPEMPIVLAGFGGSVAPYAVYVHEMTSPPYGDVVWGSPNAGPKFLEYGLKRNKAMIIATVAANIKAALK